MWLPVRHCLNRWTPRSQGKRFVAAHQPQAALAPANPNPIVGAVPWFIQLFDQLFDSWIGASPSEKACRGACNAARDSSNPVFLVGACLERKGAHSSIPQRFLRNRTAPLIAATWAQPGSAPGSPRGQVRSLPTRVPKPAALPSRLRQNEPPQVSPTKGECPSRMAPRRSGTSLRCNAEHKSNRARSIHEVAVARYFQTGGTGPTLGTRVAIVEPLQASVSPES